jgi:hypothetical protein
MVERMLTLVLGTYGLGFDILESWGDTYFQHGGWDEEFFQSFNCP